MHAHIEEGPASAQIWAESGIIGQRETKTLKMAPYKGSKLPPLHTIL